MASKNILLYFLSHQCYVWSITYQLDPFGFQYAYFIDMDSSFMLVKTSSIYKTTTWYIGVNASGSPIHTRYFVGRSSDMIISALLGVTRLNRFITAPVYSSCKL